jgi:dihydroneopterin aldolase
MPPYNRAVPVAPDLLVLEGMSFYGYHGETQAERTLGNRFHVDVEMRMDLSVAGRTDAIADTVDYSRAFGLVRAVVEDEQYSLIEAIAARIAASLLGEPGVDSVKVRVGKQPPIAGAIDRCSVIIERFGGGPAA